jgi:non-specific serine/threonine protein kinase/serine/threonine-protein kinase
MNERDVFIGALQHADPVQRRAYLEQACGAEPALRQRVEALLRVAEQAGSFLEAPAPGLAGTAEGTEQQTPRDQQQ